MGIANPDLLHPLRDNNRDEFFLIEYDGFIKSITESIVLALFTQKNYEIRYPGLLKYDINKPWDIYDAFSLYSPEEALYKLSENTLSDEEIYQDITTLKKINTLGNQSYTIFETMLSTILKKDFTKNCCFVKKTPFCDHELKYITDSYFTNINKISILSGDIVEIFKKIKPTSCFLNSLEDIISIIKSSSLDELTSKLFILRNTSKSIFYAEEDKMFHFYPETASIINTFNEEKKFMILPMYTFRQNEAMLVPAEG